MKRTMWAALALVFLFLPALGQTSQKDVIGDWEGESLCTIPDSPCHNEHVIYHIQRDEKDAAKLSISANKVVNGEELYMGTITCTLAQAAPQLRCSYRQDDHWDFTINGDEMKGTLVIPDNKLYRRISVKRKK